MREVTQAESETPEQMGLLSAACLTAQDRRVLSIADSNLSNAQCLEAAGYVTLWYTGIFWAITPTESGRMAATAYESALSPIREQGDHAEYVVALDYEQQLIFRSDRVPAKPDPQLWTAEEYAEKLAEYNRLIRYKLSPLGNYVYRGPRSTDPQDQPLPYMSKEEIRQSPEYGILTRRKGGYA